MTLDPRQKAKQPKTGPKTVAAALCIIAACIIMGRMDYTPWQCNAKQIHPLSYRRQPGLSRSHGYGYGKLDLGQLKFFWPLTRVEVLD